VSTLRNSRRLWAICRLLYGDRVLAFDSPAAEIAGSLADLARGRGQSQEFADIAIAATARRHDLTILSRNEHHFTPVDAVVIDPFWEVPPDK
jgi:toxin FitB